MQTEAQESKQGVLSRLRKAPGCGVTELRFGSPDHPYAVCFDGVSWSLHRLAPSEASPTHELYSAGSLLELMNYLESRWPLQ